MGKLNCTIGFTIFLTVLVILSFFAGYGFGYKEATENNKHYCFDMFEKISVDNIDMDFNVTGVYDWMESRGYKLGCSNGS